jgi:hypothetical protein
VGHRPSTFRIHDFRRVIAAMESTGLVVGKIYVNKDGSIVAEPRHDPVRDAKTARARITNYGRPRPEAADNEVLHEES